MRQCLNPSKDHGDYNTCLMLLNRLEAVVQAQPQSTDPVSLQPIGALYQVPNVSVTTAMPTVS